MDKRVGEILARLEADGLSDSTLVVFWSDHGMGLPRGKRWVHDTGTHIPLLVRWPGKLKPASLREDLTSILDLPPTMLKVAGIDVPKHMHGRVLFTDTAPSKGASDEPPYLFFHRDRMDEVYELQRSCRDRRWRYIRNFEPEKPYSQQLDYMDQMPAMIAWRRMAAADQLVGGQKNWFAKTKPIEELYDTEQDPWELNNLALQGEYADRLKRMREATEAWQVSINDMGLIPEAVMMEEMLPGDKTPQTEVPVANVTGGQLSLTCLTEGSSIVYRVPGEKGKPGVKNPWLLYVKSISVPDGPIEFQASRLGYRESPIVQWNAK
jgi:arylsulfatase A-like enzyme